MKTCCFCIDLATASRAIALTEMVLAVPCIVSGVASLSITSLAAGMLLFVSAWVLFDGVFLHRSSIVNGWLVITLGKVLVCLISGILCVLVGWDTDYILGQLNAKTTPDEGSSAEGRSDANVTATVKTSRFLWDSFYAFLSAI